MKTAGPCVGTLRMGLGVDARSENSSVRVWGSQLVTEEVKRLVFENKSSG